MKNSIGICQPYACGVLVPVNIVRWTRPGLLTVFLILFLNSLGLAEPDKVATPMEAIKGTISSGIAILQDPDWSTPDKAKARREKLEALVAERFNYREMSKRALGKSQWNALNAQQQQEFVQLFTDLLVRTYADKIESYSGEPVEYLKERVKGKYAEVQTKVVVGKEDILVKYRMLQSSEAWQVYDVVLGKVSLVENYQAQFSKVIKDSSYDGLVKKLKEKTHNGSGS